MAQEVSTRDQSRNDTLDKKDRKRLQNRIAQRTYRHNQKQRIQILEATIAQSTNLAINGNVDSQLPDLVLGKPSHMPSVSNDPPPQQLSETPSALPGNALMAQKGPCPANVWHRDILPEDLDSSPDNNVARSSDPSSDFVLGAGRTALHRAASLNNTTMAMLLLEQGADISACDAEGNTPLHLAAKTGSPTMVKTLLDRLADPEAVDYQGRTALFPAVQSGNEAVIELLLVARTNVDQKDYWGTAVLHVAVESGAESVVRLLLKHGANINA